MAGIRLAEDGLRQSRVGITHTRPRPGCFQQPRLRLRRGFRGFRADKELVRTFPRDSACQESNAGPMMRLEDKSVPAGKLLSSKPRGAEGSRRAGLNHAVVILPVVCVHHSRRNLQGIGLGAAQPQCPRRRRGAESANSTRERVSC